MNYYICKNKFKYGVFNVKEGQIKTFWFLCTAKKYKTKLQKLNTKKLRGKQ